ncbi:MAG: hypothetical protein IIC72_12355 [Acidobacteria bacterium]|nr:hypothetical protein [Acidobacteriota bacterium]
MEPRRKAHIVNLENLPEPTTLTDAEFLENLRTVMNGTINALADAPDKVALIREGVMGLLVDTRGVMLFRRADLVDLATEELMVEIADELGKDDL